MLGRASYSIEIQPEAIIVACNVEAPHNFWGSL